LDSVGSKRMLLGAVTILFWFTQFVYIPFFTSYLLSLSISAAVVGVIIGVYGFTQMVLKLPIGIVSDGVVNHKFFIVGGCLLAGISSIGMLVFPNWLCLILANGISGVASSTWVSFTVLYSFYYNKAETSKAIGLVNAFNNIGIVLAYAVGGLLYQYFGMGMLFAVSFSSGILAAILALFIKKKAMLSLVSEKPRITRKAIIGVMRDKRLWFFSILSSFSFFILFASVFSFSNSTAKQLGASGYEMGILLIIFSLAGSLSSVFSGTKAAQNLGEKNLIIAGFLILGIYCGCVASVQSVIYFFPLQLFCGLGGGVLGAVLMSAIVKYSNVNKKATAMGFYQTIYGVGMTIGPVIMGYLVDTTTQFASFSFLTFIALACALTVAIMYRPLVIEETRRKRVG